MKDIVRLSIFVFKIGPGICITKADYFSERDGKDGLKRRQSKCWKKGMGKVLSAW